MSLNYALLNGSSGLRASQTAITTVSHNISNSSTEGYTRQRVQFGAQPAAFSGRRGGRGAQIESIDRVADRFANDQVRRDRTLLGYFNVRQKGLAVLESRFTDDSAPALNNAFDTFFNSLRDLTRDPSNKGARSGFVNGAQQLAATLRGSYDDFRQVQADIDRDIDEKVSKINSLTAQIAELNNQVLSAGDGAIDYMDQRDVAIRSLSELIPITVHPQKNKTVSVQLQGVGTLVQEHLSASLSTLQNPAPGAGNLLTVQYTPIGANASSLLDITAKVNQGELGGLLDLRDRVVGAQITRLNQITDTFMTAVNNGHQAGFDLRGNTGLPLFTLSPAGSDPAAGIVVNDTIVNDVSLLAIAGSKGNAVLDANGLPVLDALGNPTFTGASGDAINGMSLSDIQYAQQVALGGITINRGIAEMTQVVGQISADNFRQSDLYAVRLDQSEALRESISGVSTDDEMMDLTKFQKQFEANGKVIKTVSDLMDSVLQLVR